ncbi:MAG: hypothetical protein K2X77_05675 [Candidatus Obscuribacterales bacterium]|nr:hypothetical protein [Candidatus Obscuribacterales bacterium]
MPENSQTNRVEVPANTPECAMPVEPPNPLMEELQATRKETGTHMSADFYKATIKGLRGQHFETRLKSGGEEITNVITGQKDTYRNTARVDSEFQIKDQNGLTTVKTAFGPQSADRKENISKQSGERRGHDGAILSKFEITFDGSGRATQLSCTDASGKTTLDRRPSSIDWTDANDSKTKT